MTILERLVRDASVLSSPPSPFIGDTLYIKRHWAWASYEKIDPPPYLSRERMKRLNIEAVEAV